MGNSKSKSPKKLGTKKVALKSNKKSVSQGSKKKSRKRKVSDYLILQTAISKYCADRYSRLMSDPSISADEKKKIRKRCTKKEVSEIYQGLKSRFLKSKSKGIQINASDLSLQIEEKLSYKGRNSIPFTCREFEWFYLIDTLYGADGFFFKPSDVLNFNCEMGGSFKKMVFSTEYNQLEDTYKEDMYSELREYMEELQSENDSSVKPFFVFNEELSDIENRIFWWDLNSGLDGSGGSGGSDDNTEPKEEDFGLTEDDIKDEVKIQNKGAKKKSKEGFSESVLLEMEKTKQEQEKSKQMAMELYKSGLISKEEFLKLAGI